MELKVNFDAVPAKLRGLKNKPGTTNPADITRYVRKKANYPNKIDLVYALTTKVGFAWMIGDGLALFSFGWGAAG